MSSSEPYQTKSRREISSPDSSQCKEIDNRDQRKDSTDQRLSELPMSLDINSRIDFEDVEEGEVMSDDKEEDEEKKDKKGQEKDLEKQYLENDEQKPSKCLRSRSRSPFLREEKEKERTKSLGHSSRIESSKSEMEEEKRSKSLEKHRKKKKKTRDPSPSSSSSSVSSLEEKQRRLLKELEKLAKKKKKKSKSRHSFHVSSESDNESSSRRHRTEKVREERERSSSIKASTSRETKKKETKTESEKRRRSRSLSNHSIDFEDKKRMRRCHFVPRQSLIPDNVHRKIPRIDLYVNHFRLEIPNMIVFLYQINMTPLIEDKKSKELKPIFAKEKTEEVKRLKKLLKTSNRSVMKEVVTKYSSPSSLYPEESSHERIFFDPFSNSSIQPVFDGDRHFYTTKCLLNYGPSGLNTEGSGKRKSFRGNVWIKDEDNEAKSVPYGIEIKFVKLVNIGLVNDYISGKACLEPPDEALKALDIIMAYGPVTHCIPLGLGYFSPSSDNRMTLSVVKHMSLGHFQTIRTVSSGPTLNIDQVATTFMKAGPIVSLIAQVFMNRGQEEESIMLGMENKEFDSQTISVLHKYFTGVKVSTTHLEYKRKFKLKAITDKSAENIQFHYLDKETGETRRMSVVEYFDKIVQKPLKYPKLPCVETGAKGRPVYLPLEVLVVEPNQSTGRLSQQEQVILGQLFHTQKPQDRLKLIRESAERVVCDSEKYLKEFSIRMDTKPLEIQGFVLPRPVLLFGDKESRNEKSCIEVTPSVSKWDMKNRSVFRRGRIKRWLVLNLVADLDDALIKQFIHKLIDTSFEMGIKLPEPLSLKDHEYFINASLPPHKSGELSRSLQRRVFNRFGRDIDLIVFIFDGKNHVMYADIKYTCDVKEGVSSQCIASKNVEDFESPGCAYLMYNLLMKINVKMGGINSVVSEKHDEEELDRISSVRILKDKTTMLIGADVTHQVPHHGCETVSVSAVVASMDDRHYFYRAALRIQEKEIIYDMKGMMYELLDKYHQRNKCLPNQMIVFRDGVADNTFDEVMKVEVQGMKDAFTQIARKYRWTSMMSLTMIVVQKRHHTRFVCKDETEKRNIPPGSLVEEKVVHPTDFDFYLCSHESHAGTARPTHYQVVHDENNLSAEDVYQMTFNLCHCIASAPRILSIPAPVQYAHLAAKRARNHLFVAGVTEVEGLFKSSGRGRGRGGNRGRGRRGRGGDNIFNRPVSLEKALQHITIHENLSSQMYFI